MACANRTAQEPAPAEAREDALDQGRDRGAASPGGRLRRVVGRRRGRPRRARSCRPAASTWFWQGRRHKVTHRPRRPDRPEIARKKARELAAEVELGGDPSARRRAARDAKRAKAEKVPDHTMDALWRLYARRRPEGPAAADAGRLCRHLAADSSRASAMPTSPRSPRSSCRRCTARSPTRAGIYAANRTLAVVSILLAAAVKAKWRPDNPARGVERHREHGRERYLSPEEIERLLAVVDRAG